MANVNNYVVLVTEERICNMENVLFLFFFLIL